MPATTSKTERTRRHIIEQTAPVFNTKGFAGTSLQDLTKATGLTKGSIYGNFENKDAVALAAFDHNFERVTAYLRERILSVEHAVDRLLVYPAVYRQFLKISFLRPGCPILNTATEADDTHPALREKAAAALAFWKKTVKNQVKRGLERKEIRKGTDPSRVAAVLMSLIEGGIMQAKLSGKSGTLKEAMDFLEEYLKGLRP